MNSYRQEIWESAAQTLCPFLRYLSGALPHVCDTGVWLAEQTPPCSKRTCGKHGCHNFGKAFEAPDPHRPRYFLVSQFPLPTGEQP